MLDPMCRNITELRGLEPAATDEEITAAARQYVRKVSGITRPSEANAEAFEIAVAESRPPRPDCWASFPPAASHRKKPFRRCAAPEVRARLAST